MRIEFEDGGYLEIQRSRKSNNVWVMVAVKSEDNPLQLRINSAEVELNKLTEAVQSVTGPWIVKTE